MGKHDPYFKWYLFGIVSLTVMWRGTAFETRRLDDISRTVGM